MSNLQTNLLFAFLMTIVPITVKTVRLIKIGMVSPQCDDNRMTASLLPHCQTDNMVQSFTTFQNSVVPGTFVLADNIRGNKLAIAKNEHNFHFHIVRCFSRIVCVKQPTNDADV